MDVVRCKCPRDVRGTRCGTHPTCALHGWSSPHPSMPYKLTAPDRQMLRTLRIAVEDSVAIEAVRQSDERRFNPPRRG